MKYKIKAAEITSSYIGLDKKIIYEFIEDCPNKETGDFSIPCFKLCKFINKNPNIIAKELCENIFSDQFEKIKNVGPYLNFFINKSLFSYEIINNILKQENILYKGEKSQSKNICIECVVPKYKYCFKMCDLLSMITGKSLSRIYESQNNNVVNIGYIQSEFNGTQYDGKFINNISSLLKYEFDKICNEETYNNKTFEQHGLQQYIFNDGLIKFISLEKYNMAPYIIWTSDCGNTEKLVRLNSFIELYSKYNIHKYIHIGDLFDTYEFKQLLKIIEIIQDVKGKHQEIKFVHNNILSRNILSLQYSNLLMKFLNCIDNEKCTDEEISDIIFNLFINIGEKNKKFNYDNKYKSLNYIRDTCRKINRIIDTSMDREFDWTLLSTEVRLNILKKLDEFTMIVQKAADEVSPANIAIYILEIATEIDREFINTYNNFLNKSEIELLKAVLKVINYGLYLLGIDNK